jgi:hypothetical protein
MPNSSSNINEIFRKSLLHEMKRKAKVIADIIYEYIHL